MVGSPPRPPPVGLTCALVGPGGHLLAPGGHLRAPGGHLTGPDSTRWVNVRMSGPTCGLAGERARVRAQVATCGSGVARWCQSASGGSEEMREEHSATRGPTVMAYAHPAPRRRLPGTTHRGYGSKDQATQMLRPSPARAGEAAGSPTSPPSRRYAYAH